MTIAVKRLHPQYAKDPDFVSMFLDEANLVSRIRHPNVVPTLDVVNSPSSGLLLVMEYVHGDSLSRLARKCRDALVAIPIRIVGGIMSNVLLGLHAAHEARGNSGEILEIVHRDVSPQNILVGADGVARVLDFGVAKAAGRSQTTREGQVKGKLAYMAPEQIRGKVDRRTDVFAAGIMMWELVVGRRMFDGEGEGEIISRLISGNLPSPSKFNPSLPAELIQIVMRSLSADPNARFATAKEMAIAIERTIGVASPSEIGDWVESLSKNELAERGRYIEHMERASAGLLPARTDPPPAPMLRAPSGHFNTGTPGQASYDVELAELHNAHSQSAVFVAEPSASNGRAWIIAVSSSVVAVIGVALVAFAIMYTKSRDVDGTAVPSTLPAPPTSVTAPPTAVTVPGQRGTEPSPSSGWAAVPQPSASVLAPTPLPSAQTTVPNGAIRPTPVPIPAKPKVSCDPPFTLDAQGHRHYKPECPLE